MRVGDAGCCREGSCGGAECPAPAPRERERGVREVEVNWK